MMNSAELEIFKNQRFIPKNLEKITAYTKYHQALLIVC